MVGSQLGHYRIVAALGAGGMGEVYAAEDTRLNRRVALKLLPPDTAEDPVRLQRLQREAQAVAALNHPNVVTLYSVEEADGRSFLTMELVEGQTLDALIPAEGLDWDAFFRYARPLAGAVAAGHAAGVIHRDLKPSNIMVGRDGRVKVLDFGLAKLTAGDDEGRAATTGLVTTADRVVGSVAYMSPEQADGRTVDARTDVFSLGVVLFEMATGRRPFEGRTPLAQLLAIARDPAPPLTRVRSNAPPDLERIVGRCLEKDPDARYETAGALSIDLEALWQSLTGAVTALGGHTPWRRGGRGAWVAAAALAGVAVAAFAVLPRLVAPGDPVRASFSQLTHQPGIEWFPSLSPDGQWVVYAADVSGNRDIYLQSVTGDRPINLTADSTADDDQPAFSPDGQLVAFRSERDGGGLFVMGRTGEAVRRLTREGYNPAWAPDGSRIAYATLPLELRPQNSDGRSELRVVGSAGGPSEVLYEGDATLPSWSPDGGRIAFGQRLGENRMMDVLTVPARGGEAVHVTRDAATDWNPVWAPGGSHLYFVSDRGGSPNIWRVEIEAATGEPRGTPVPITSPASFVAHLTVAANAGRLAFASVLETQNVERLRLDPDTGLALGEPERVTTGTRFWSSPDPSPDGTHVVFYSQVRPEGDLYVIGADGTGLRQLTSDEAVDRVPRWSPDGSWIATFSTRSGRLDVWRLRPDGSDLLPLTDARDAASVAWSPDGRRLAVARAEVPATRDEPAFIMDASRPASEQTVDEIPWAPDPHRRFTPNDWSPDGRRLVGQNGYSVVGVSTFDLATRRFSRVAERGEWPVWLPDSRRLLVVSEGRAFHLVDADSGASTPVFRVRRDTLGPPRLTRDGRHAYFTRRVTDSDIWLVGLTESTR